MEWDSNVTIEFINLYQAEELIWNPRHPEYKNKFKVSDAWENIKSKLSQDVSVPELKKKKEGLMSTYRNLYQKVVQSKKSGARPDHIYKPTWFCYNMLDGFLKDIYKPKGPAQKEDSSNRIVCQGDESNQTTVAISDTNTDTGDLRIFAKQSSNISIPGKRKKDANVKVGSQIKDAYKIMKKITAPQEKDELSTYGELIAMKLRRLSARNRAIACNKIDNFLFEIELNEIDVSSSSVPQASTSQRSRTAYYTSSAPYHVHSQSLTQEDCKFNQISFTSDADARTVLLEEQSD